MNQIDSNFIRCSIVTFPMFCRRNFFPKIKNGDFDQDGCDNHTKIVTLLKLSNYSISFAPVLMKFGYVVVLDKSIRLHLCILLHYLIHYFYVK